MIIYTPLGLDDYELCHPVDPDDFETITDQINGQPRQKTWTPIAMTLIHEDEGRTLLPSDAPWLGSWALIFRPSAILALGALLREYGELLPLQCSEAKLSIFNPTQVVDALDEERSSVSRFDDGRLMRIKRYELRPDAIRGVEIFKIPNRRVSRTFVGQQFVDLWNQAGLKGLTFEQVKVVD